MSFPPHVFPHRVLPMCQVCLSVRASVVLLPRAGCALPDAAGLPLARASQPPEPLLTPAPDPRVERPSPGSSVALSLPHEALTFHVMLFFTLAGEHQILFKYLFHICRRPGESDRE